MQSDWFELVLNGRIVGFRLQSSDGGHGVTDQTSCFPTQVLDGVIALLVVHFDGLRMRTADAVTDAVAAHHDVLVVRRRPAHHNAVDQWAHVQGAGLVGDTGLWGGGGDPSETQNKADDECFSAGRGFLPSRSLSNVSAVVHSVAGPVPFTVMAETRKEYSVPRSRPGQK